MAVTHATSVRDAITDLVVDLLDAGSGAGTIEMQESDDSEAATLTFSDPAFDDSGSAGGNSDGVATADTITSDTDATGGTITHAHLQDSDSNDVTLCSVTGSGGGGDIELSSAVISAGQTVSISSLTYEAPN